MVNTGRDISTNSTYALLRFSANTESQMPAATITGRLSGIVTLVHLGIGAVNVRHASTSGAIEDWNVAQYEPFLGTNFIVVDPGLRLYEDWRIVEPRFSTGAVPALRLHRLSYSNPLEAVLGADLSAKEGGALVAFIDNLMTIGRRRAIMREEERRLRLQNDLDQVTQDAAIDGRYADAIAKELENESRDLRNKRERIQLAAEILTTQRKFSDDDPSIKPWSLQEALSYIDGNPDFVGQVRDLQTIELRVELQRGH